MPPFRRVEKLYRFIEGAGTTGTKQTFRSAELREHRTAAIARVLLTGGGTGGHIYPALAVAEVLTERSTDPPTLLFVGTRGGLERTIVPKAGIPLAFVSARPLQRRVSFDFLRTVLANALGAVQSVRVVGRFRPDCVVATGGYVAFPVVLAARLLRVAKRTRASIVLLEPNATAGLTNRLLSPLVDEVWTQLPVRASILRRHDPAEARRSLGLDSGRTTIVVMGGSQGAQRLNCAVMEAAKARLFDPAWQLLLLSGTRAASDGEAQDIPGVRVVPFLDDPATAYAAADVVVARAGASTLAELAATATPSILVPYPHATDDHQMKNARAVASTGAARIVRDDELDGPRLAAELRAALAPDVAEQMRRAAQRNADVDVRERVFTRIAELAVRG